MRRPDGHDQVSCLISEDPDLATDFQVAVVNDQQGSMIDRRGDRRPSCNLPATLSRRRREPQNEEPVKRHPLRSGLLTGALVILTAAAWLYLAPMEIGGSTSYVITRGDEYAAAVSIRRPGDRPARRPISRGQIVAYHSTVLHVVVFIASSGLTARATFSRGMTTTSSTRRGRTARRWSAHSGCAFHTGAACSLRSIRRSSLHY